MNADPIFDRLLPTNHEQYVEELNNLVDAARHALFEDKQTYLARQTDRIKELRRTQKVIAWIYRNKTKANTRLHPCENCRQGFVKDARQKCEHQNCNKFVCKWCKVCKIHS